MGMRRGLTLRSLVEVLDRVIGRGVVVESDLPVSPTLAGLRDQAAAADEPTAPLEIAAGEGGVGAEPEGGAAREDRRARPPRSTPSD